MTKKILTPLLLIPVHQHALDDIDIQKLINTFVNTTAERQSALRLCSVIVCLNLLLVITTTDRLERDVVEFNL